MPSKVSGIGDTTMPKINKVLAFLELMFCWEKKSIKKKKSKCITAGNDKYFQEKLSKRRERGCGVHYFRLSTSGRPLELQ